MPEEPKDRQMNETFNYVRISRRILERIAAGEAAMPAKVGSELAAAIIDRLVARIARSLTPALAAQPGADIEEPPGATACCSPSP
jgi:hypothetical protein